MEPKIPTAYMNLSCLCIFGTRVYAKKIKKKADAEFEQLMPSLFCAMPVYKLKTSWF